ncbi:MAG TPA: DUF3455 domain-containing protein [Mucilaginibacter sp.]|nr:DUF3455 domain-containing protein [Mucilaginibacter sp.]
MSRAIFSVLLACIVQLSLGQNKAIRLAIQAPADSDRLILHAYAKGVQMYICTADPNDTSHYVWTFTGPHADLYADGAYRHLIGKHYASTNKNPVWEDNDGSMISGLKVHQANSPDSLAIPWLLLKTVATKAKGF